MTGFIASKRIWSVKRGGWRSIALAVLVLPEVAYDLFLDAVYFKAGGRHRNAHTRNMGVRETRDLQCPMVAAPL